MKKENIHKFLYLLSAIFVAAFAITFSIDAYQYAIDGYLLGSAPLELYLYVRAIEFLLPSIILCITAIVCKKKFTKK